MLCSVEREKSFITSGPGFVVSRPIYMYCIVYFQDMAHKGKEKDKGKSPVVSFSTLMVDYSYMFFLKNSLKGLFLKGLMCSVYVVANFLQVS